MSSFCLRGYLVHYRNTRLSTTTNLKLKVVTECPGNLEQGGGGDLQPFYCNSKKLVSISRRQLELFSRLHWFDGYRPVQMIQMISIDNSKWNTNSWSSIIHKKFPTLVFRFNFFADINILWGNWVCLFGHFFIICPVQSNDKVDLYSCKPTTPTDRPEF